MNEEAKARMAAFDDGQAAVKHDDLQDLCAQFLNTVLPGKNVISEHQAKKFIPLFNKEEFSKLSESQLEKLTSEYQMTFSMYHPIKVIASGEYDDSPKGVFWPVSGKHHKLIIELPPVFRSVTEIGALGGNVSDLMTMFMNTTRNATPMNDRTNVVKDAIIAAIHRANAGQYTDAQQREYAEKVSSIENHETESKAEEQGSVMSDMEWE